MAWVREGWARRYESAPPNSEERKRIWAEYSIEMRRREESAEGKHHEKKTHKKRERHKKERDEWRSRGIEPLGFLRGLSWGR